MHDPDTNPLKFLLALVVAILNSANAVALIVKILEYSCESLYERFT
jgi:hypothetical protein